MLIIFMIFFHKDIVGKIILMKTLIISSEKNNSFYKILRLQRKY